MRYILTKDLEQANRVTHRAFDTCGNISATGSVSGMQAQFGWPKHAQVKCGSYIYNVGLDAIAKLRAAKLLRGE